MKTKSKILLYKRKSLSSSPYLFNQKIKQQYCWHLYTGFFTKEHWKAACQGMVSNNLELVKPFTEYEFGKKWKRRCKIYFQASLGDNLMNYLKDQTMINPSDGGFYTIGSIKLFWIQNDTPDAGFGFHKIKQYCWTKPYPHFLPAGCINKTIIPVQRGGQHDWLRGMACHHRPINTSCRGYAVKTGILFYPENASLSGNSPIQSPIQRWKSMISTSAFHFQEDLNPAWYQYGSRKSLLLQELNSSCLSENKMKLPA